MSSPAPHAKPSPLYEAIAAHAVAACKFNEVSSILDEIAAEKCGYVITDADHVIWETANKAEVDTRLAVCAAPTNGGAELRLKARYVQAILSVGGSLEDDEVLALLDSAADHRNRYVADEDRATA